MRKGMEFSDALIWIGGSYWAKQGMKRVYFDNLERWYGLAVIVNSLRGAVRHSHSLVSR